MFRRLLLSAPLLMFAGESMAVVEQNKALSDLAVMFFSDHSSPTFGASLLNSKLLDFSVESLSHVDEYLEKIRKDEQLKKEWNRVVLRCGAYVGEVVRRNATNTKWVWIGHDDAVQIAPQLFASAFKSVATAAVLFDGKSALGFPLGKVEKYLENGAEDSVKFFAEVMINQSK